LINHLASLLRNLSTTINSLVQSFDNVPTFFVVPRSVVLEISRVQISGVPGLSSLIYSILFDPTSSFVPSDVSLIYVIPSTDVLAYYLVPRSGVLRLAHVPRILVRVYECVLRIGVPTLFDVPRSEDPT
jgi:hypothetical protein